MHGALGLAHAVGAPQESEFGFGGQAAVAIELPLAKPFGLQAELSATALAAGSPIDSTLAAKSTGVGFGAMLGARVRPFVSKPGGLWLDVNGGVAPTGDVVRPTFDAHVGWDASELPGASTSGRTPGTPRSSSSAPAFNPRTPTSSRSASRSGSARPPQSRSPSWKRSTDERLETATGCSTDEDACPGRPRQADERSQDQRMPLHRQGRRRVFDHRGRMP